MTGCAGFIGRRLLQVLRDAGHEVMGLDRVPCDGMPSNTFLHCDLLDERCYIDALATTDMVCHLAAARGDWGISEAEYFRDNLEATRTLIGAMKRTGVNKCLFYSTVAVLGPSDVALTEASIRKPINAYGASKAACEELFEDFVRADADARVIVLRPSAVFGPANPANTNVFRLIDAIYRRRFLMVGRGEEVKTTSFMENLLEAHRFLMRDRFSAGRKGYEIYHYVDSPAETTRALVTRIQACLERKPAVIALPRSLASLLGTFGDVAARFSGMDIPITSARIRKFCTPTNFAAEKIRALGYTQPISNEAATRMTVEWYLTSYLARTGLQAG